MAGATARHLVRAEAQGLPTHGMSRVPFYCGMLRKGRADGAAQPAMLAERAAVCLIDNRDGLPYVSAQWAIDEVIHGRVRLGVMAYLASGGTADFNELKARLQATDGNLSVHLRKLEEAGYVAIDKSFVGKKPLTRVSLTESGRAAFIRYLDAMAKLVGGQG